MNRGLRRRRTPEAIAYKPPLPLTLAFDNAHKLVYSRILLNDHQLADPDICSTNDTPQVVADEVYNHEVFCSLLGRVEDLVGHIACHMGGLLDGALDGSELAMARPGPAEEALGAAAYNVGAREGDEGAERGGVSYRGGSGI